MSAVASVPTAQRYPDAILPGADVPVGGMRFYIASLADFLRKTLEGSHTILD